MTKITFKDLFVVDEGDLGERFDIAHFTDFGFPFSISDLSFSNNCIEMVKNVVLKVSYELVYVGPEEREIAQEAIAGKIYSYFKTSSLYYDKLLTLYKTQEDKLLKEISSKFGLSEMPQSATMAEIEKSNEDDLSRVRVQLTEGNTPMGRLDEIQRNYHNILEEWSDDFISKFIVYESGSSYMEEIKENEKNG